MPMTANNNSLQIDAAPAASLTTRGHGFDRKALLSCAPALVRYLG
jgi:hypothetical protein